jgi:hypothetical protein
MMTRLMTASVLAIGLLASTAMAANEGGYCAKGSTYDRETLTCVDNFGAKVVDEAGFAVGAAALEVNKASVGDYIDETVSQRNERTSN